MVLSKIESIDANNLSSNFKTVNGIGLCYFDPEDEILKEFNPTAILPIYPGEFSKRQFYIVIDDTSLLLNTITFTASLEDSEYSVKSSLDYNDNFEDIVNNNSVIVFVSQYPSGIMPITVYIKNDKDTLEDVILDIELETF